MNDIFRALQMFGAAIEHTKDIDLYQYIPNVTTRKHAREYMAEFSNRKIKPLTKHQRRMAIQAHHNTMDRRDRLGLPRVGRAAGPKLGQSYENLNSFAGNMINLLKGMQYNSAGLNSKCIDGFESFVIGLDTSSDILSKIYIPAYWAEGQV